MKLQKSSKLQNFNINLLKFFYHIQENSPYIEGLLVFIPSVILYRKCNYFVTFRKEASKKVKFTYTLRRI